MRYFLAILSMILVFSCGKDHRPAYESVKIETLLEDSLSIRAIIPINRGMVLFAADKGMVGWIDEGIPNLANFKYNGKNLHFRSIAKTSKAIFVLSIDNPAVLYKIDFDGKKDTHIQDVYVEEGEGVFYDAMAFWNDREGIAMGDPVGGCLSVILTKDGGNHWEKLPCDVLPPAERGEAAFAASNSNIALYKEHVWIATGGMRARVFHSPDKGKSWEVFDTPIVQGRPMMGIYSIAFYDEKKGVIFGGDWEQKQFNEGNKATTVDGGKTWKLVSNGAGPGYRSSVKFVPGGEGEELIAVGSEGMDFSDDFGETWRPLSKEGFYALEFVNDSIAFASGKGRLVRLKFH